MTRDRDIETAGYSTWNDMVGNYALKSYLQTMVKSVAGPARGQGINTIIVGPSRTGKTSSAEFAITAMICRDLDKNTWTPCWKCIPCLQNVGRSLHIELDVIRYGGDDKDLQYVPVNGNNSNASDLDCALELSAGQNGRWLYYIDEIQGLVRRNLDEALYKAVEQRHLPGNSVLITSKPRLDCIRAICDKYAAHNVTGTNQIMFRFTIGAIDEANGACQVACDGRAFRFIAKDSERACGGENLPLAPV